MPKTTEKAFDEWTAFYQAAPEMGKAPLWPAEPLVRMMKGNYIPGFDKSYVGKNVLEIGFGAGNNFVFLGSLGLNLYGAEVSKDICVQTKETIARFGYDVDLREGSNRSLPFEDNFFDYIVSWNVIHYENTEANMRAAIAEHARVLKPGGRLFISTVAPDNKILENHKIVGDHRYQIGREDDFRKGEVFFCFDSPSYVQFYWGDHFKDINVGRVSDYMFSQMLDWYLITGVKK
jgi:SAM-dependent methyltransferase